MIEEHAHLTILEGRQHEFERAFGEARAVLGSAPGCRSVRLFPSVDHPRRYLLVVEWERLEDHTEVFPTTPQAAELAERIAAFFDGAPVVTHFAQDSIV